MEKTIAVFTIFTFLLFSISTAQIALHPFGSESSTESVTVAEKPKSELDQTVTNDRLPESEYTQTIDLSTIDQTPRLRFARSRAIKRHSFDRTARIPLRFVRRQPCRKFHNKFMLPRTERSYGNDMIVSSKTYSFDTKAIGDQVPTEWLEFKHRYGHQHHHHHQHHDRDEEFVPKEKREHKGGFMRSIRKFLKHTFD